MVRVPTYNSYMNMISQTMDLKSKLDLYSYQTMSGLKAPNYSGYGMQAHTIVSLEAMLGVTENFIDSNDIVEVELNAMSTAMDSLQSTIQDFKSALINASGMDLSKTSPDETGGQITFGNDTVADYIGTTLTINGTTYTFSNTAGDGLIDISGATDGAGVAAAVKATVSGGSEFTINDNTLSFPLYTVDGPSTVLNVADVTTGEPYTMSEDQYNSIKSLQTQAFSAMKMLVDVLNTNVNGKYLFGGGDSNEAPINFPFSSLEEFQAYYDGVNITYPDNTAANQCNRVLTGEDTGALTLAQTGGNTGSITAANAGAFVQEAVNANDKTTGTLTFDADKNTINATQYGAFSTISAGDTLVINGDGAGNNGGKVYVVESVSADGKTITVSDTTPIAEDLTVSPDNTNPDATVTFGTSFPVGTVINMEGFNNSNIAPQVQVTGVSADGSTLFVTADPSRFPNMTIDVTKDWSLEANSYYVGGNLSSEKIISDNQSLTFDINGNDPAFDKMFRALGMIAQGNIVDTGNMLDGDTVDIDRTLDRVEEAMDLIQSSIYSSGVGSTENNADIYTVLAKLNSNTVVLNSVQENHTSVKNNLENSIYNVKNVDQTKAAVMALMAANNLNASYACMQQVMNVSLLNYL